MNSLPSEKILVSIDFTETSLNALDVAIQFCRQQQTGLHLLYILPYDEVGVKSVNQPSTVLPTNHLIREGDSMIQMLATIIAQEQHVFCSASLRVGLVHEEIINAARMLNPALIVMGTHIGSSLQAFQTNNEAYQVIKTAPCPVLTVPDNHKRTTFGHVLFPIRPIPYAAKNMILRERLFGTSVQT
ncbi:universal stress protein [Spirosoma flavus]